jgi:siroheme synthase 1
MNFGLIIQAVFAIVETYKDSSRMITVGLSLKDRPCLVVGGGEVALRRIKKLIDEEASIMVVSPDVLPDIARYYEAGVLQWIGKPYSSEYMVDQQFVIIATDNPIVNTQVMDDATAVGAFINRADVKDDSTWVFGSTTEIGDLEISIFTNQVSPRVSRLLRQDIEIRYGILAEWLPQIRLWRQELQHILDTPKEREQFWRTNLGESEFIQIVEGQGDSVKENIVHAISRIRSES